MALAAVKTPAPAQALGAMTGKRYIESLRDGREVWILRQREGVAYVVTLPDGADFTLEGPTAFERKG